MKSWTRASDDEIWDELEKLKKWIEENPGKFDGVAEKSNKIKYLERELLQRYPSF